MTMLSSDQREVLQELTNIGMGQAGDSISRVWNEFVQLSIPSIVVMDATALPEVLVRTAKNAQVAAARQAFHGGIRGEVLIVIAADERHALFSLMGANASPDLSEEHEAFLDVSNILAGACVSGLAHQLGTEVGFTAPSLMGDKLMPSEILKQDELSVSAVLNLEVHFCVEKKNLTAYLLILFPEEEFNQLTHLLDRFLESLEV